MIAWNSYRGSALTRWGFTKSSESRPLIARVITIEIKLQKSASNASNRDQTVCVSKRFITRGDVASSRGSDRDPTAKT